MTIYDRLFIQHCFGNRLRYTRSERMAFFKLLRPYREAYQFPQEAATNSASAITITRNNFGRATTMERTLVWVSYFSPLTWFIKARTNWKFLVSSVFWMISFRADSYGARYCRFVGKVRKNAKRFIVLTSKKYHKKSRTIAWNIYCSLTRI